MYYFIDATPNRAHELSWPYNTQAALKVWRALYFSPAERDLELSLSPQDEVSRGRYLVQGLAHCSACHAPRDGWGGGRDLLALTGGVMPSGWYAPSLLDPREAGVQGWTLQQITDLLRLGRSGPHGVSGPMAEVVASSTSLWKAEDLQSVAAYLHTLPSAVAPTPSATALSRSGSTLGAKVYDQHCAACHGPHGQGYTLASGRVAYPALAGNRTVTMASSANLAHIVMEGGFGLPSPEEPHPFGMPPFVQVLSDHEMAALLSYLRTSWGNAAPEVSDLELHRLRESVER